MVGLLPSYGDPAGLSLPSAPPVSVAPAPPVVQSRPIGATTQMFHISRAMYRELAGELVDVRDRKAVLSACERTVQRLVTDRFYFAHPARTLFNEVRWRFP